MPGVSFEVEVDSSIQQPLRSQLLRTVPSVVTALPSCSLGALSSSASATFGEAPSFSPRTIGTEAGAAPGSAANAAEEINRAVKANDFIGALYRSRRVGRKIKWRSQRAVASYAAHSPTNGA